MKYREALWLTPRAYLDWCNAEYEKMANGMHNELMLSRIGWPELMAPLKAEWMRKYWEAQASIIYDME